MKKTTALKSEDHRGYETLRCSENVSCRESRTPSCWNCFFSLRRILAGSSSVCTKLNRTQHFREAVNDRIGIEPIRDSNGSDCSDPPVTGLPRVPPGVRSGCNPGSTDRGLFEIPSDGAVPEKVLLTESGMSLSPRDWSMDGRFIVFAKLASRDTHLWVLPLFGGRKRFPFLTGSFTENQEALSPNGRSLAYVSNESGQTQVMVRPFPDPSPGKWQISTDGGTTAMETRRPGTVLCRPEE
jgi:WD40-like Beta Propeller Repeat